MNKRILAMAMAVAMLVTCVPQTAYATNGDTSQTADASVSDVNNSQVTDDTTISDVTANDGSEDNENSENVTTSTEGTDDVTNSTDSTTDIIESETEVVSAMGDGNSEYAVQVYLNSSEEGAMTLDQSYATLEAAVEDLPNLKSTFNHADVSVTINLNENCQLTKDITLNEAVVLVGAVDGAVLDLNGHTISLKDAYLKNLNVISSATAGKIVSEALVIDYGYDSDGTDQTIINNVNVEAERLSIVGTYEGGASEYNANDKCTLRINGNVTTKGTANYANIGSYGTTVIFGTGSIVNVGNLDLQGDAQFYNLTVSQCLNVRPSTVPYSDLIVYGTIPEMTIAGTAEITNVSVNAENKLDGHFTINLLKGDSGSVASLTVKGDSLYMTQIVDESNMGQSTYMGTSENVVLLRKVDSSGNVVAYTSGETLATVSSDYIPTSAFFLDESAFGGNDLSLIREGKALKVATPTVKVTYSYSYQDATGKYVTGNNSAVYDSLEKGIAAIGGADFSNGQGEYTVELFADCVLSKNITVPKAASQLTITTGQTPHVLDMNGCTLTSENGYKFTLSGGATLANSNASKRGKIFYKERGAGGVIDATDLPSGTTVIDGVDLEIGNESAITNSVYIELTGKGGYTYSIKNSSISANMVKTTGGNWKAEAINSGMLYVGFYTDGHYDPATQGWTYGYEKSTLEATSVTTHSLYVHNTTTIDELTIVGGWLCVQKLGQMQGIDSSGITPKLTAGTINFTKSKNYDNGKIDIDADGVICAETINFGAHEFINRGTMEVGTFTSSKGANIVLIDGSAIKVTKAATLFDMELSVSSAENTSDYPKISVKEGATLVLNGSVKSYTDGAKLNLRTVDEEGNLVKTEAGDVIFTTNIQNLDTDLFYVDQPKTNGKDYNYHTVMHVGNDVKVAADWITVGTIKPGDGGDIVLKKFTKWSDAIAYVNEIANSDTDYFIEFSESVNTLENFSVPSNAKTVTIRGKNDEESGYPTFSFLGNITASTNLKFKNIKLQAVTYNKSTGQYETNDKATLNLNGKSVSLNNAYFVNKLASVTGNGASSLTLAKGDGMTDVEATLTVTGALTTGNLSVNHYAISASKVTSTADAKLKSADIVSAGDIVFKDLTSIDANNKLTVGAGKANKLTISGTFSDNGAENSTVTIKGADGQGTDTAVISTNAISISSRYIENEIAKAGDKSYADYTGQVLATAAKLPTSALVIGKQGDNVSFLTKKNGNNLVVDPAIDTSVVLYEVDGVAEQVRGNFATLQDALTEIDRYADKNASYVIRVNATKSEALDANGNGKVTSYAKDLTMPRQLASLTITSMDDATVTIYTKGALTLNSALTLKNVKVDPKATLAVNLGNNKLTLDNSYLATEDGKSLASVNGANTSGASELVIKNDSARTMTVTGNLRVSKLNVNGANITVHGTVAVGEIIQEGIASSLRGTAKVATKKVNGKLQISDVTPNITIDRTITSGANGFTIHLDVAKTENRVTTYVSLLSELDDYSNYDEFRKTTGIKFAKALKADPSEVSFTKVSLTEVGSVVKKGGFFVYTSLQTLPYTLTTDTDTVPCFSFADAVTEINNRNDKNADYTITLNASDEYYRANPETYVMPAAAKIHSLTIQAKENHATLYYGTKNAKGVVSAVARITLTTNTTIKNVTFMDAEVVANTENGVAPKRAPFTFALGGKNATFDNVKFEGRALIIDGGRNGELTLTGKNENIIEGNITNVKTLTLDADATLLMKTYVSNARGAEAKPTLSVTNFTGNNNKIRSEGSISLVNVTSTGTDVSKQTVIEADGAFTISGTVTASLDNNLVLIGRQKNDRNKTPQLNVTGTVAGKKVLVALLPYDATAQNANTPLVPGDAAGLAVVTSVKNGVEKFGVARFVDVDQADVMYTGATVANFDPTATAAERGIALVKTGNVIYAYDACNIHVGVKIVDESALATRLSDLNNEDMMGYYLTFADAVNAINAKNNKNNCYDIVLLDDINVASVALPAANKAKAVSVQGYGTAKKLTVSKAFAIPVNTTLIATTIEAPSVSQTAKTTLTMKENSVIDGTSGAVSLQNIATDGTAKINYTRNNRSQSQLTIAGDVTNTTGKLTLCMAKDYKNANAVVGDSASYMANDKAEINADKLLFTGAKVKSGDVEIKIGEEALTTTVSAGANAVVKNANGFYFVNSSFLTEAVGLGDGDAAPHTYYLDLNQATNQIKVNADKKDYTVYLGVSESGNYLTALDANVTDRNDHSAIVLPANNTVGSLTIKGKDSHTTKLYYSGSITGYIGAGKYLTFESIEFVPVAANDKNGVAQPVTNSNITLNRNTADRTGEVSLVLDEVVVTNGNGDEGYLNAIVGQKNATNVETNNPLTLVTGFTNVNTLTIKGANEVVAGGRSSINTLDFEDAEAGFVAIGATTVGNIVANATGNAKQGYGYITGTGRGFTLTGGVIGSNTVIRMEVLKPGAKYTEYDVVDSAVNIDLLTAPKADPARFALYGETVGTSTKVAYKFGNTIRVDEKANLKVKVTGDELSAYAHDYPEAIAAINTWGDKTKDYTITFLDTAGDVVTTNATKNIAVPTNITYPRANAAKSLTVTSENEAKTLRYTANLSPVVATTFDKVKLDNGTYNGRTRVFTSYHNVNIAANGAALTFTENAKTVSDDNGTASATFDVNAINSTKGLTLNGQTVKANGAVTVTTLNVNGDVAIRSTNGKAITLTNVVGSAGSDFLTLDDPISGSATALNAPQLKINGTVTGVEKLILDPLKAVYNGRTLTGWEYMTLEDLEARRVTTADTAANLKTKVLSTGMQKVPTDIIVVRRYDGVNPYQYVTGTTGEVYKSGTNLYLIASPGYLTVEVATDGYEARFLTWTDAVNDINARKDKNADYTITLLNNVGNIGYNQNADAVGNVTFPATTAAKSVTVTEPDGEDYTIYFTNTTLSIPTNVTIDGVEMVPVKKQVYSGSYMDYYTNKRVTYRNAYAYENSLGFAINITGNNTLTFAGTPNENNVGSPYMNITTISGANLRLADEAFVYTTKNVTVKNLYMEHDTSLSMSEKANLTVQNSAITEEQSSVYLNDGNASMKDPNLKGSVNANNITFTGTASLSQNAYISSAVSKTKGQGRLTIANLVIGENGCNLTYKQDANGNPMLNITGTVTRDSNLTDANKDTANARISVLYNNCSMNKPVYVSLTNGSKMFMAVKVTGENVGYFMPVMAPNGTYGHILTDGYELYKLPKNNYVFYGAKPVNAL